MLVAGSGLIVLGVVALLLEMQQPSVAFAAALPVLLMACAALVLVMVAHWMATPRFHIYAVVILLAVVAHQVSGIPLWLSVAIAGVAVLIVGVVVLVRFLRANPKIGEETGA